MGTRGDRATEWAIQTTGLRKTYRTRRGLQVAVEGLDLEVPRGGIHGFLGPNGSGKTTTIRMLLGLVRPDSGTIRLFGEPVPERLATVISKVGAIVESPKFFGPFSARLNLQLAADAVGVPSSSVERVLSEVGLTDRADDRFETYSLGMKQRLAVAATLLKDPELLIFDEPTNGLDPSGIHDIRETIRSLGKQGRTVLVSSHILSEVQQVADTVSIIARGRLLASGPVDEIIGNEAHGPIEVRVPDLDAAARVLSEGGLAVRQAEGKLLVDDVPDAAQITRLLASHDLFVTHLSRGGADLESVFLQITQGATLGAAPGMPTPRQSSAPRRATLKGDAR